MAQLPRLPWCLLPVGFLSAPTVWCAGETNQSNPVPTQPQEAAALEALSHQRKVQSSQILLSHLCSKETNGTLEE